jgi:hypothetical protein
MVQLPAPLMKEMLIGLEWGFAELTVMLTILTVMYW